MPAMTTKEVSQMIESIGLPYAYYSFPEEEAPALPYILFYYPQNEDFKADNRNYSSINALNIELYTKEKDFETERKVQKVLLTNDFIYQKRESYIQSEQMYEVLYETDVYMKGDDDE